MLEVEIQKLTAAVEALTEQIKTLSLPTIAPEPQVAALIAAEESYRADDAAREALQKARTEKKPRKSKEPEPVAEEPAPADSAPVDTPADPAPSVSKDNLKDIALQISKADSDAKVEIFAILSAHGAKTITALPEDPDTLFDVFTRLTNLAARVAKAAE